MKAPKKNTRKNQRRGGYGTWCTTEDSREYRDINTSSKKTSFTPVTAAPHYDVFYSSSESESRFNLVEDKPSKP